MRTSNEAINRWKKTGLGKLGTQNWKKKQHTIQKSEKKLTLAVKTFEKL